MSKSKPAEDIKRPEAEILEGTYEEDEDFPEDYPDYYPAEIIDQLIQSNAFTILEKREDTRGRLALVYTVSTFAMFVLAFLVAVLDAYWRKASIIENLSTILPLISGIFLGSLGFVLGYYFRQLDDTENSRDTSNSNSSK